MWSYLVGLQPSLVTFPRFASQWASDVDDSIDVASEFIIIAILRSYVSGDVRNVAAALTTTYKLTVRCFCLKAQMFLFFTSLAVLCDGVK